jgi:lipid-binding SYLF domain-containing protein
MQTIKKWVWVILAFAAPVALAADSDEYAETIAVFKSAGESSKFFKTAYGYAVFPNVGKAGVGVGGAFGKGRVYQKGVYVGDTSLTQASIGLQLGGQVYQQIVFLQDKAAFDKFTSGNFSFGAEAEAVAITAAAGAQASTAGSSAVASGGEKDAATVGDYHNGMAVFTVAKGGLMYQAAVNGQHFSYKPK